MASLSQQVKGDASKEASLFSTILQYIVMALSNAFALVLVYGFVSDNNLSLALVVGVIAIGLNLIFFIPQLYPLRWMAPGLALVTLLVIYPIIYTVSTSFTNMGDGHLFSKERTISLITARKFVPESATTYRWEVMQAEDGNYALWLSREVEGKLEVVFAPQGEAIDIVEEAPAETPETYNGYRLLKGGDRTTALGVIQSAVFGIGDDTVGIKDRRTAARPLQQRYIYDATTDTITDVSDGKVYRADNVNGEFVPQQGAGDRLSPGYSVNVGFFNFTRLVTDPGLRGPLVTIFIWTVAFSFFSVLTTFSLGLFMALVLNDPNIPGRKVIRSLLIIPYAIPGVISILVWRGLLNENLGLINTTLIGLGIIEKGIPFLNDAQWSKFAIILVNLWLGYPYMMLITSGALQAIPSDIYEAAAVDGARPWQSFWKITLPLLMVSVGPLLIASFTYNFNNFLLIDALTSGNPPILGSPVPAGYTDILISYTYRLAFGTRGADYGYASAITIVIFFLVAAVTLLQYRFTKNWEEVGENV